MRPALTRSSIVEASRELLVAEGLDAVSLRRIASHLGVTAPALYAYVTDKLDLLRAIATGEVDKLLAELDAIQGDDPIERLRHSCEAYASFAKANAEVFRAVFLTRPELMSEPIDGSPPLARRIFDRIQRLMQAAADEGRIATDDPALAALTWWAAVHGAVVLLTSGPRLHPDDDSALVGEASNAILTGLGAGRDPAATRRSGC